MTDESKVRSGWLYEVASEATWPRTRHCTNYTKGWSRDWVRCQRGSSIVFNVNVPSAPAAYKARTVSNPMPEFPPVTTACFPVKLACSATSSAVLEAENDGAPSLLAL